ncbi:MAG: hypothetical protein JNG88_18135, partial [Phycisphaerales bacterium]|nr:hypothetical protein [Phycisphaerales bacterium]
MIAAGCDDARSVRVYEFLQGTVSAVHVDTGEISVEFVTPGTNRTRVLSCVVTRDTELYLNDLATSLARIAPGDAIQVIGVREPDPRLERLAIATAYVAREEPAAPVPPLALRAAPTGTAGAGEPANVNSSDN